MEQTKIGFDLVGMGSLLKSSQLGVPIYQRSYSWRKDEQIRDFWSDLRSAFAQSNPEYFLGTVVLSAEGLEGRLSIIDGQQRIATTALLMAAIRDEYSARQDDRHTIIHTTYLASRDLRSGDDSPRLVLNSDDDPFFRGLIGTDSGGALDPSKESHELMEEAYARLREYVGATADDAGTQWADKLSSWVDYLENRVRVISVSVPSEADAFLIFETLNDRGADLTIADLLKNYLFGKAGQRLDSVRDGWMQALGALDIALEESTFTMFLRHYWSSKYGATRERELYRSIKEHVTNEATTVALVHELKKSARLYAALLASDHDFWSQAGSASRANVETLLRLGLEQQRPLLLAAMQHFTKAQLKNLLRHLVSWSVRGLIVGGIGGGSYEKAYCDAAIKIRDGQLKTVDQIRTELADVIPTDLEFERSFAVARVTRPALARYYLVALEDFAQKQPEPELVANDDEEKVNLEHVLPKSAKASDWPQFTADETKAYLYRIGNLCLLSKGPNDRIGNKPWSVKRPVLKASALTRTKQVAKAADWTPEEIKKRQEKLATDASKVWPR